MQTHEERKKPPRPLWRSTMLLAILVSALFAAKKLKETPTKATIALVPGADTTWLVEPARADGTVDYASALAAERGVDATECDAAARLAHALGREPGFASPEQRARLPGLARPFVELDVWIARSIGDASEIAAMESRARAESALDAYERVELDAPDAPLVRAWLEEVGAALDLASAAASSDAFHVPSPKGLFDRPFRAATCKELGRALGVRAICASADGRDDAALADLRAALALAQTVDAPGTLVDRASCEERSLPVWKAAIAIAEGTKGPTPAWCAELLARADHEPLAETLARGLRGHRIEVLDLIAGMYRGETAEQAADEVLAMARESGADPARAAERADAERRRFRDAAGFAGLDPNRVFRRFNEQWDRVEAILLDRRPPWERRLDHLAALEREIAQAAEDPPKSTEPYARWMTTREARAAQIADHVLAEYLPLLSRSLERWLHATLKVDRDVRRLATIAGVPAPARERP